MSGILSHPDHRLEFAHWLANAGRIGEGHGPYYSYVGGCVGCGRNLDTETVIERRAPHISFSGFLYSVPTLWCADCAPDRDAAPIRDDAEHRGQP